MTKSRLVYVPLAAPYADHKYGFPTTIKESEGTVLGHIPLKFDTPVSGLLLGANHPKPKRATKTFSTGTTSSFIAPTAIAAASAAGWDIQKAKSNGRKHKSRFQTPVYVTLNGIKYAWAMKNRQKALLGANLAALGIREVAGTELDLVFGATFPKPPRVKSLLTVGKGSTASIAESTTFYDPTNEQSLPVEFAKSNGQFTQADWADFV